MKTDYDLERNLEFLSGRNCERELGQSAGVPKLTMRHANC